MKKLRKLTIEELGRTNPVIEGEELRRYVGGTGPLDDIWPSTPAFMPYSLSNSAKQNIVDQIALRLGYNYNNFNIYGGLPSDVYGKCRTAIWSNGYNQPLEILITNNSSLWGSGNIYDIALTMVHEQQHWDTPGDAGQEYGRNEFEAFRAMLLHPYMTQASIPFQMFVLHGMAIYGSY
jgi:hypothetical protein